MIETVLRASVVVPTFNRLERLKRVISALEHQTLAAEDYEIIVVSDGSTDGTDDYLASRSSARLVATRQSNAGPAAARNHGVQIARGEIVVFVDDDIIARPDLLDRHLADHAASPSPVAVIGPMMTPPDFRMSTWIRWEQEQLTRQYERMTAGDYAPTFRQFFTGNASVERERILALGGFDTRFRRAEDVELGYRLARTGMTFVFDPRAIGLHYAERSFSSWLQNGYDYGRNEVVFARQPGRSSLMEIVSAEFADRGRLERFVTDRSLAHHWLATALRQVYRGAFFAGDRLHLDRSSRVALSALYKQSYFQGVADELGSAEVLREMLKPTAGRERIIELLGAHE
jgi:GT2 family glycosyltransferase